VRARSTGAPRTDIGTGAQLFAKKNATVMKKRMSTTQRLLKEVKANECWTKQRFQGISKYRNTQDAPLNPIGDEVGGGAYWFYNNYNTTTFPGAGGVVTLPLYMFDLTSATNVYEGSPTTYAPFFRLNAMHDAPYQGMPWFSTLLGQAGGTGAQDILWNPEDQPRNDAEIAYDQPYYLGNKAFLAKTDIDLFFYGAASYATEFCIQLVQLKEQYLHPSNNQNATPVLDQNTKSAAAFYQWYIKQFCAHPLAELDPTQARLVKVLYEKKFTLQNTSTNEGSFSTYGPEGNFQTGPVPYGPHGGSLTRSIGHNQRFKVSLPWKKMMNFDWAKRIFDPSFLIGNPSIQDTYPNQDSQTLGAVDYKNRIYLTIRALNPIVVNNSVSTSETRDTPSFDMKIRNNWVKFST